MDTAYAIKNHDLLMDDMGNNSERKYVFKIKDLGPDDRPRERLLKYGPGSLALAELLAIVLGTGTKKEDVLSMANRVLKEYGEYSLIGRTDAKELASVLNIPMMKAMQIVACGEIGRRFYQKKLGGLAVIRTAKDVFDFANDMRQLPKEQLRGIYLNTHHQVIHDEIISMGTINANLIHPREVFKPALEYGAVAVVLVHNHPSGVVSPSQADIEITKQLVASGKILGISVVDHIIISNDSYVSINVEYN